MTASGKDVSPWCRGVEGQEHDVQLCRHELNPNCQPVRDFVRDGILADLAVPPLDTGSRRRQLNDASRKAVGRRRLTEDWECFHRARCRRCRRHLPFKNPAVNCPVKRGLEPAGLPDPPQWAMVLPRPQIHLMQAELAAAGPELRQTILDRWRKSLP